MMTKSLVTKPLVGSLRDLEYRLGLKRAELLELVESRESLYQPYDAPKKQHPFPGNKRLQEASKPTKYRRIDNPIKQLKDIQKRILTRILSGVELPAYMFGAVSGKTLLSHAAEHVANQSSNVVSMDISKYYPNVTCHHIYIVWHIVLNCPPPIASLLTELTTYDWHLPQGAPTSPAIANIFLASIYAPIVLASERKGLTISTWVDDLIFSGPAAREVMESVRAILASHGFKASREKRKILGAHDEKVITGARLGRRQVRAPHKLMTDLRAAIHRLAIGTVLPDDLERYRQNLVSRIAHVGSLHPGDAAKLKRHAAKRGVLLK
jgi:RNA-directed DNA polymerase